MTIASKRMSGNSIVPDWKAAVASQVVQLRFLDQQCLPMSIQDQDLLVRAAKIPHFDALVHRASSYKTVIVLAPVSREDLVCM